MIQGEGHEAGKSLTGQEDIMKASRSIQMLKTATRNAFPDAYTRYLRWQHKRVPVSARIAPILASDVAPIYYDDHFDRLQRSYTQWWPEYGYDEYSTWARGCERAMMVL